MIKHPRAKKNDDTIDRLNTLFDQFVMANSPIYKVSVLDNRYHVVNMRTNITHTVWPTMDAAMQSMRDLNRMAKRVA